MHAVCRSADNLQLPCHPDPRKVDLLGTRAHCIDEVPWYPTLSQFLSHLPFVTVQVLI